MKKESPRFPFYPKGKRGEKYITLIIRHLQQYHSNQNKAESTRNR